ncbi:MAG TPA: molybdopterin cofactor-binding domain-containing protein, partial [Caulobacteraceae bacterium]
MAERPARIGAPELRIDGPAKVTGAAIFPSDAPFADCAYAVLVLSTIARGRVTGFDLARAGAVRGVIDILTHENVGQLVHTPPSPSGQGATTTTLESDKVWFAGQIVAIVLAETFEAASEGALAVKVAYAPEPPASGFDSPGAVTQSVKSAQPGHEDPAVGMAEVAFAAAPVTIDARYSTPTQHHNPMELFTTACAWEGDRLIVHESSQYVTGLRASLAKQIGVDPKSIRVLSKYIGGAFGSRGAITSRTAWIAIAARRLGRPVKLAAARDHGFTIATYR